MKAIQTFFFQTVFLFSLLITTNSLAAETKPAVTIIKSHALAMRGTPKYGPDFKHWEYANPEAPKGGEVRFGTRGTFDNFNRFAQRGSSAASVETYLLDDLMVGSADEINVAYGLIAESVEYASDSSSITFNLNPKATFQDGKPIMASDVVFTFNKLYEEGIPQIKVYYKDIKAEVLAERRVKFTLPAPNKEVMFSLASLSVFPEHIYKDIDLSQPSKQPIMGSGAYVVDDFKMGQYVVYKRINDYWAKDHPTQRGVNNFSRIRYDYYLDETVLFEAFKKGDYDFRLENISKNWATQYKGPNFEKKHIITEEIPHSLPQANQAYAFNIKRPIFKDINVRKALTLLFDFEWTNKNIFYGAYSRNYSYFMNTPYAAKGLPGPRELEILTPFKDKLPPEVFSKEFKVNKTKGDGKIRNEIRQALRLFKKAGYTLKNSQLVDKNGKQFEFELLMYSASSERIAIPFQKNIEKIGAKMNIRLLSDTAQFTNRMRDRDYDMITNGLGGGAHPSPQALLYEWHTDYLTSTYNAVGTTDPTLDALIMKIKDVHEDDAELLAHGRAFDRILLWRYYSIPQWHISKYRIAYWNKFSRPKISPKYSLGQNTWWVDTAKATALEKSMAK